MSTLATYDVGLKIGVEGDAAFTKQLQLINQQSKELAAEMKAVTSSFNTTDSSEKKLQATTGVLTKQIANQEQKIGLLTGKLDEQEKELEQIRAEYEKVSTEQGKDSVEAQKLANEYANQAKKVSETKTQINNATTALNSMTNQMENAGDATEETSEELKQGGDSALTFGDMLKANVTSQAIIEGVKALASAVKQVAQEIVNTVKETTKWADDLNTLSIQTGLSTDQLQEFEYMSSLLDVDVSTISGSLRKLTNNMDSARNGTGSAAEAFARLGVSVTDDNDELRSNYDVFMDVIDALGEVQNETERDAIAMDIFGRSAQELNTLVEAGSDQMAAYAAEAHDMGYVLDEDAVQGLVATQDAMDRLDNAIAGFKNRLVADIAPGITDAIEGVMSLLKGDTSMEDFLAKVTEKADQIAAEMPAKVEQIAAAITENLPAMIDAGVKILMSLLTGIIESLPALMEKIPQITTSIITSILKAIPQILIAGGKLILNLVKGMWDMWNSWDAKIKEIGHNLVQGIWAGISNGFGWIKEKISGWVDSVLSYIKNLFGIHSPSKETAWMGEKLGEGLAEGILDTRRLVDRAWGNLTGGMLGTGLTYAPNYSNAGAPIFNITQMPGEDGAALAQRINRELGRMYA